MARNKNQDAARTVTIRCDSIGGWFIDIETWRGETFSSDRVIDPTLLLAEANRLLGRQILERDAR